MTREQSQLVGGVLLLIVALSAMGAMLWAAWSWIGPIEHVGWFQLLHESIDGLARHPGGSEEFCGLWS